MKGVFGKYRALVSETSDPEKSGRIRVVCPSVYGDYVSPWCLPCVPLSADGSGFLMVPRVGETVWVEFEEGDPELPIWCGGWWGEGQAPSGSDRLIRTEEGHELRFESNGVKLKHSNGSTVVLASDGSITITASGNKVVVNANATVNGNAKVTGTVTADTDCIGGGISLKNHTHPDPQGGYTLTPV